MMTAFLPLALVGGIGIVLGLIFMFGFNIDQNDRRTILYPIFLFLIGSLLGVILYFGSRNDPMNEPMFYIIMQFAFFLIGLFHNWWIYKKLFWTKRDTYKAERDSILPEFIYTLTSMFLVVAGLIVSFGFFSGFVKTGNYWAIGILFILPFLFIKTYDFLNQIPKRDFSKKWTFSSERIGEDNWEWANETWVNFEVKETREAERLKSGRTARFRILVPRKVPLREMYRLAVREYNKQGPDVVVQDLGFERNNEGRFWWLFSIKWVWNRPNTWFRKMRYLDPFASSVGNEILTTDTIVARRMPFVSGIQEDEELGFGEIAMGEL
jgi:Type VI secretion system, TssN